MHQMILAITGRKKQFSPIVFYECCG